jgi:ribosomal protein S18 acetylase RimI-like enzyme
MMTAVARSGGFVMLDKSIPYKNIIMRLPYARVLSQPAPVLPDGFSFRFFQEGDEKNWARIETSVLEFDDEASAVRYFTRDYLPFMDDLKRRCVFVMNRDKLSVATATAWYASSRLGYQASLHWVSVMPIYQGLGLGKSVVQKALSIFPSTDPGEAVWLHTQTWSHVAVQLYHKLGFNLLKTGQTAVVTNSSDGIKISPNDYEEAIEVLKNVIKPDLLAEMIRTAE